MLTSIESIERCVPDSADGFFKENTPAMCAFYFPDDDIADTELAKNVQLKYNYVALLNRVVHSYEYVSRVMSGVDDPTVTKSDTVDWIKATVPDIKDSFLEDAIFSFEAIERARALICSYESWDGNNSEDSSIAVAMLDYIAGYDSLPDLVDDRLLEHEDFSEWYDKRRYVRHLDDMRRMRIRSERDNDMLELCRKHLYHQFKSKMDFDKKTILALEYVILSRGDDQGIEMLGEIIETGIYTKYLYEAWISWRAHVQIEKMGPSSFSAIPNNYYDMMRVKCIDTYVRHCLKNDDPKALSVLEMLMAEDILHRQGSMAGNEAVAVVAALKNIDLIQPEDCI